MTSSYYLFLFTFISLTFLSINNLNPTAQESPNLINNICSNSLNASFCVEYLKPLYHNGDTLQKLTQNTIQSSSTFLFLIYDDIRAREIQTIKDPVLNDIYHKCGVEYTAATNSLNQAKIIAQSGDYQKLFSLASNALSQTQSCDKNFGQGRSEPSDFKSLNQKGQNVCSIIVALLSKHLLSGKKLS